MNTEVNQIKQITDILDPFDTGYINWRKFIMNQARVLPIPNIEYIIGLKQTYKNLPSYQNGKISKSDYLSVKLWYEDLDEDETITIYKRYKNLKDAMFYFFMVENTQDSDIQFLAECQKENKPEEKTEPEEKVVEGDSDKKNDPIITISTNEKSTTTINLEVNDTTKVELLNSITTENVNTNEETIIQPKNEETSENINGDNSNSDNSIVEENVEEKPTEKELFDVTSFLMCCCCDTNQKVGIEKAFNIVSDNGLVTAEELYNIYNYGLYIVDDNYWHTEKETDIPYPKELFYKVFEDLNVNPEDRISFTQLMKVAEKSYPILLTCPFYQLEKIVIEKK